jgi:hypothetical protein
MYFPTQDRLRNRANKPGLYRDKRLDSGVLEMPKCLGNVGVDDHVSVDKLPTEDFRTRTDGRPERMSNWLMGTRNYLTSDTDQGGVALGQAGKELRSIRLSRSPHRRIWRPVFWKGERRALAHQYVASTVAIAIDAVILCGSRRDG